MQAVITLMMAISLAYIALEVYRYARKYYILYKTKKDPLKPWACSAEGFLLPQIGEMERASPHTYFCDALKVRGKAISQK